MSFASLHSSGQLKQTVLRTALANSNCPGWPDGTDCSFQSCNRLAQFCNRLANSNWPGWPVSRVAIDWPSFAIDWPRTG